MKKSALLLVFAVAAFFPTNASATSFVDDSEYGIQNFGTSCANFSHLSSPDAHCFFSDFTVSADGTKKQGYLVGYDTLVSNVEVTFSNIASVFDFGVVICDSFADTCHDRPTWDLDVINYPNYQSLFSSTSAGGQTPIVFDLNGTFDPLNGVVDPGVGGQGHQVAFLVISGVDEGNVANISVRSLAAAPIPEPASLLLLSSGVLTLFGARRRKR